MADLFPDASKIKSPEYFRHKARVNILSYSSFIIGTILFLSTFIEVLHTHILGEKVVRVFLSLFAFGLGTYAKTTENVKVANILFNTTIALYIPYRMYVTGGFTPIVFELAFLSVFNYAMNGPRWGFAALIYSTLVIAVFEIGLKYGLVPHPDIESFALAVFFVILVITLPVFFLLQEKKELHKQLKEYEKHRAALAVMYRLTHEVGNSLHISLGNLDQFELTKDFQKLQTSKKRLEDLDKLIWGMNLIAEEGTLIEFLEKHKNEPRIIEKISRDIPLQ